MNKSFRGMLDYKAGRLIAVNSLSFNAGSQAFKSGTTNAIAIRKLYHEAQG